MLFSSLIRLFKRGNVSVDGLRGTGKDMLFGNVIARRKEPYVSNTDYHCKKSVFIRLEVDKLRIGNNFQNLIEGDVVAYDYPYPERCDVYISDAGIYFPAQYQDKLVKLYPDLPTFCALSRHLADCNVHFNVQTLARMWDKFREQSDIYIKCLSCHVLGKLVFQRIRIYEKYQSCVDNVKPFKPLRPRLLDSKELKAQIFNYNAQQKARYDNEYGSIKTKWLIYRNKSKYDTRLFKGVFSRG